MATPRYKLVSFRLCPFVQRSVITLIEKGVPHDVEYIDLAQKPDWFLERSPLGKVPILLVDDVVIFESAVINEYIDEVTEGSLHPDTPVERARHRSWIEFGSTIISAFGRFYSAETATDIDNAVREFNEKLRRVESEMSDGPFFAGDRFSLVDAAYAPVFRYFDGLKQFGDFGFTEGAPRLRAWSEMLLSRDSVQRCAGPDYEKDLAAAVSASSEYLRKQLR